MYIISRMSSIRNFLPKEAFVRFFFFEIASQQKSFSTTKIRKGFRTGR
jgi:hypothetical protein